MQKSMGYRGGKEETLDIPVTPDDSTPIQALQGLAVDGLATGTPSPSGCLGISGRKAIRPSMWLHVILQSIA
jgi:hypothetical protein